MSQIPGAIENDTFQSPPPEQRRTLDINDLSTQQSPMRNLLSVISPNRANKSSINNSLLQTLFPARQSATASQRSQSPYRDRSRSNTITKYQNNLIGGQFRNEQEFKETTSQALKEEGYDEDQIKSIQSNMILFKSIEAVKEYKEYMKDKMNQARNSSLKKTSTVNKTYKKNKKQSQSLKNSRVQSKTKSNTNNFTNSQQHNAFGGTSTNSPTKNSIYAGTQSRVSALMPSKSNQASTSKPKVIKPNLAPNIDRTQRIQEIEQILLQCSQPFTYTKRPNYMAERKNSENPYGQSSQSYQAPAQPIVAQNQTDLGISQSSAGFDRYMSPEGLKNQSNINQISRIEQTQSNQKQDLIQNIVNQTDDLNYSTNSFDRSSPGHGLHEESITPQKPYVQEPNYQKEFNQIQQERDNIINSIEEMKQKENLQSSNKYEIIVDSPNETPDRHQEQNDNALKMEDLLKSPENVQKNLNQQLNNNSNDQQEPTGQVEFQQKKGEPETIKVVKRQTVSSQRQFAGNKFANGPSPQQQQNQQQQQPVQPAQEQSINVLPVQVPSQNYNSVAEMPIQNVPAPIPQTVLASEVQEEQKSERSHVTQQSQHSSNKPSQSLGSQRQNSQKSLQGSNSNKNFMSPTISNTNKQAIIVNSQPVVSNTPMRKKSASKQPVGAGAPQANNNLKSKTLNAKEKNQNLLSTQKNDQLTATDAYSEQITQMQSPESIGKYNNQMMQSMNSNSIFQSPAPNNKWANSSNGFQNTLAGMNTLNSDAENQYGINEEQNQEAAEGIQINKKYDSQSFIDSITFQYQRKKDDTVQQLLEEYRQSRTCENKPEHPEKWIKRGDSPTKRLIQMKKQAHISHPTCKELKSFKVEGGYSLKYVASPTKSYLVNPKEGVIDYSDAQKNFGKFFDRVSNQPIVKHRIVEDKKRKNENRLTSKWYKTPMEVKSKLTTRPRMRGGSDNRMSVAIGQ